MPLYEYECLACRRHTEKIQKFSDPEITTCPHCGGSLKRVITAPAIAFKGGGWYADGYGNAKPSGESKNGDAKVDAAAPSTTETKPANSSEGSSPVAAAPPASAPAPAASPTDKK